ncbi:hypothetical protein PINS_up013699 [Pythium insidiosum]|nr:hypothetical protein PINS_up013699 [Pythium insidiosum]
MPAACCFSPTALRTTLLVLVAITLLDVRDLWFKWRWLGASDDLHTRVFVSSSLRLNPLSLEVPTTPPTNPSGIVSFFQRCEAMETFRSPSSSFFHARLRRCQIDGSGNDSSAEIADLVATSSVRVDSMAWAACQLLYLDRRPPLCHEPLVLEFPRRAGPLPTPSRASLAVPLSPAEAELLLLLEVLSQSAPLSSVVCVEGVETLADSSTNGSQPLESSLFGCASASAGRAAFVGRHAAGFAALHRDLAWLTALELQIVGLRFEYRQRAISRFLVKQHESASANANRVELTHELRVAVVTSGSLFRWMLCIDALLLALHVLSACELARFVLGATASEDEAGDDAASLSPSFLLTSLYRSPPVAALATLSALLSWFLVLPCSVIWTYSDSVSLRLHAALTMLRLWVLPLFVCRAVWDAFAWLSERRAYALLRLTFVSSVELCGVFACVLLACSRYLVSVRDALLLLTRQRLQHAGAFKSGVIVRSNAFDDAQDAAAPLLSDRSAFAVLFTPLLLLVALSSVATALLVAVRFVLNARRSSSSSSSFSFSSPSAYARLPAEELLRLPIRARQLVRGSLALELELVVAQRLQSKWLRVDQWLEVGVLLRDGQWLQTRRGFLLGLVQPKIHAGDGHAVVGTEGDGSGSGRGVDDGDGGSDSPTKRRRMSAHMPTLR